ncbi:MAG: Ig-like domain-containing protein [Deltaproteobacteria bacterium]|nr:Ig-like domain-containing protein [Deltaproteobacteria bacterium]
MTFSLLARASLLSLVALGVGCLDQPFATNVDLPLQVLQMNPSDGAVDVARDSEVQVVFNLPVVVESITPASFLVEDLTTDPATVVPGAITYSDGGDDVAPAAVFKPTALLPYSTTLRVTIAGSDTSAEPLQRNTEPKGALLKTVSAVFTTEDPPPLAVVSIEPAGGASGVDPASAIRVTFSEPVRCATVQAGLAVDEAFDAHPHNGALAGTVVATAGALTCVDPASIEELGCENGACTVTFTPTAPFALSSVVTVTLQGGTRDDAAVESFRATAAGGQLPATVTSSFIVLDPPPLRLVASNPGNGATLVPLDTGLTLTFSEDIDCTTFGADDVVVTQTLDDGSVGPAVTASVTACAASTVTLAFSQDFNFSATIEVALSETIESAIATTRGGQLDGGALISFTTEDPPALRVVRTDPGNGATRAFTDTDLTVEFSEDLDCASVVAGDVVVVETFDARVAARLGVATLDHVVVVESCAGNLLVLDVDVDLELSSAVSVTLPGSIESARATSLGGQLEDGLGFSWSFTTDDPTAFVVVFTSPGDGNILVQNDGLIEVRFSEPIDPLTVTDQTFVVEQLERDVGGNLNVVTELLGSYDVVGDTVLFTPPADLEFDTLYRFRLTTGLASLRATDRSGNLPVELSFTFETAPTPPVDVVSANPPGGSLIGQTTPIEITFNQDVFNIEVDLAGSPTVFLTEILDPTAPPDVANAVELICDNGCATGTLYSFRANAALNDALYALVIKGGVNGVRGAVGGSFLLDDFVLLYRVVGGGVLVATDPADGETGVNVSDKVCAVFLRNIDPLLIDDTSFSLAGTDDLEGQSPIPALFEISGVNPVTGLDDGAGGFTSNKVCLVPQPARHPCRPVDELLLANTTNTLTIDLNDQTDPEAPIVVAVAVPFETGGLPALVDTRFESIPAVGVVGALAGRNEIPVNGTLVLSFEVDIDVASIATVSLRTAAGAPIASALSVDDDEVTLTPAALLAFNTAHAIDVVGGASGLRFTDGRYLGDNLVVPFTTSPANVARVSPLQGENALETTVAPFVFDRAMFLPSLNTATITARNNTTATAINGAVATSVDELASAVFNPLPTFPSGDSVTLTIGVGALDFLGNPMPAPSSVTWPSVQGAAAANARVPDAIAAANVAPNAGAVAAGQEFVLTFQTNNLSKLNNRMLPQSFNNTSARIEQIGTCGAVAAHVLGQTHTYVVSTTVGGADAVRFRAAELFRSGCSYRVTLAQSQFSNIHTIGDDAAANIVINVTGETTAPTLATTNVDGNPTNVGGGVALAATFSEAIDGASVSATNVTLTDVAAATAVPGSVVVTGGVVTFTPAVLLDTGRQYALLVGGGATGLADLAGNRLAANQTRTFTIETGSPTVTSSTALAGGALRITFSEAIDAGSVSETTFGAVPVAGTITVKDAGGNDVIACSDVTGGVVTITPFGVAPGTALTVTVSTAVADLAGNTLAADSVATLTTLP